MPTTEKTSPTPTASSDGRRTLPENYTEAEALIKGFRPVAGMVVEATDGLVQYAKTKPLTERERKDGEWAIASLMYEEGLMISARILVLMWIITVFSSRAIQFFEMRKKEQEERKAQAALTPSIPGLTK